MQTNTVPYGRSAGTLLHSPYPNDLWKNVFQNKLWHRGDFCRAAKTSLQAAAMDSSIGAKYSADVCLGLERREKRVETLQVITPVMRKEFP